MVTPAMRRKPGALELTGDGLDRERVFAEAAQHDAMDQPADGPGGTFSGEPDGNAGALGDCGSPGGAGSCEGSGCGTRGGGPIGVLRSLRSCASGVGMPISWTRLGR